MNDAYDKFAAFAYQQAGIVLKKEQQSTMMHRLRPLLASGNNMDFAALVSHVCLNPRSPLSTRAIEAITINESSFFRDKIPFTAFEETMLPSLTLSARRSINKTIKVWCAAASTGQEPYSLVMKWLDLKSLYPNWSLKVVGTDINQAVLKQAQEGLYNQFEVQRGLPINLLVKHFSQEGDNWRLQKDLRQMVRFQTLNLMDPLKSMGLFDVIFCRNVLIYFDKQAKIKILQQLFDQLTPDGFLVLGSAETMVGLNLDFQSWERRPGIYRRRDWDGKPLVNLKESTPPTPAEGLVAGHAQAKAAG